MQEQAVVSWRTPEFVNRVRSSVSHDQYKRFRRIYSEPFYVLEMRSVASDNNALAVVVEMSGSRAGSAYRLSISRSGSVTCSCMDASVNCRRIGCVCKHACFLAVRVLRVADAVGFMTGGGVLGADGVASAVRRASDGPPAPDAQASGDEDGRLTARFTEAELDRLCDDLSSHAHVSSARRGHSRSLAEPSRVLPPDFNAVKRPPSQGDECPVCYCDLLSGGGPLVGCPDCGNGLHRTCAERWMRHAPRRTCVYCRSTAWAAFGGSRGS